MVLEDSSAALTSGVPEGLFRVAGKHSCTSAEQEQGAGMGDDKKRAIKFTLKDGRRKRHYYAVV